MISPSNVFISLCIVMQLYLSYFSIRVYSFITPPLNHHLTKSAEIPKESRISRATHLLDVPKNYLSLQSKEANENKGFGGYWPGDPNAKKYNVTIQLSSSTSETISLLVPEDRYIYFYFEEMGFPLPFINAQRMCRQGCCTICTARVLNSQPLKEGGEFTNKAKVKMDSPLGIYALLIALINRNRIHIPYIDAQFKICNFSR